MSDIQENQHPVAIIGRQLETMRTKFCQTLPAHIPLERFERVILTAVQRQPELLNCDRMSLWNAALQAASDGLLPDGREGAFVPFKGQAQWIPMVQGIRKKARNSGEILSWDVYTVHKNDEFEFQLGDDAFIRHRPALENRGPMIAVYSIARLKGGETSREVMSKSEVDAIRNISRSPTSPAWNNFYDEMARKTVARRHSKALPTSADLDDLIRRDDHLYDVEGQAEAKREERAQAPRRSVLDAFAAPAGEEIKDGAAVQIDPETCEILNTTTKASPAPKAKRTRKPKESNGVVVTAQSGVTVEESDMTPEIGNPVSAQEPQGRPPASEDDFPGDRPSPSEHAPTPPTEADLTRAYRRGIVARQKHMPERASPGEYRTPEAAALLEQWRKGWQSEDMAQRAGTATSA